MNGTCKECHPVTDKDQDEPYLYTFYADVVNRPEMRDIITQIQTNIQRTVQNVKKYLLKFKKYKALWKSDKVIDNL
jgi:dynein heavy chain, axonemal